MSNIAFGGSNSVDTIIIDNKISNSHFEGIYMIECGNAWIIRNHIYDNYDGIVSEYSIPLIEKNEIY